MSRKEVLKLLLSCVEGKISDKQFRIHDDFDFIDPPFLGCSRPSGFKSSLHCVNARFARLRIGALFAPGTYRPATEM
jgi:hypothetical protein